MTRVQIGATRGLVTVAPRSTDARLWPKYLENHRTTGLIARVHFFELRFHRINSRALFRPNTERPIIYKLDNITVNENFRPFKTRFKAKITYFDQFYHINNIFYLLVKIQF